MATVKVQGHPLSGATATVIACLQEKQVDYEFVTVDLSSGAHKQPSFLALNPFGQVPVVQDADLTLFESRAIVKYLAKKYEGQGPNLLGSTLAEQALVEQWSQVEGQSFNDPCSAILYQIILVPMRGGQTDEALVASNVEKLNKVLDVYEEKLSKSKYLAGDFFSLADLQHLVYIHYLVNACGKGELISCRKHVSAWWEDISSRPAWKKVTEMMKP
uniref:glutathione transferase n=1 Tax=Araucaria cunninghamii TaxID=56994 RepID=A0A0D6R7W7_ARACU